MTIDPQINPHPPFDKSSSSEFIGPSLPDNPLHLSQPLSTAINASKVEVEVEPDAEFPTLAKVKDAEMTSYDKVENAFETKNPLSSKLKPDVQLPMEKNARQLDSQRQRSEDEGSRKIFTCTDTESEIKELEQELGEGMDRTLLTSMKDVAEMGASAGTMSGSENGDIEEDVTLMGNNDQVEVLSRLYRYGSAPVASGMSWAFLPEVIAR